MNIAGITGRIYQLRGGAGGLDAGRPGLCQHRRARWCSPACRAQPSPTRRGCGTIEDQGHEGPAATTPEFAVGAPRRIGHAGAHLPALAALRSPIYGMMANVSIGSHAVPGPASCRASCRRYADDGLGGVLCAAQERLAAAPVQPEAPPAGNGPRWEVADRIAGLPVLHLGDNARWACRRTWSALIAFAACCWHWTGASISPPSWR